jgi:D-sedoheptulose 7-phosphate isomerase
MTGFVEARLTETAEVLGQVRSQAPAIHEAAEALARVYRRGGKLLLCGNGGSAADAQHIAGELTGRFLRERAAWPAIALHCNSSITTAIANDYSADVIFSRQVEALGRPGDMLWALSTSGRSRNCIEAMVVAKAKGVSTLAFVGGDGGEMRRLADLCVHVPHSSTPRVQEVHIVLAHIICELVEVALTDGRDG